STDTWFRPCHLTIGPEGALYILDFYREVIETPLSLPEDIKKRLNLETRRTGRIWRVVPEGFRAQNFRPVNVGTGSLRDDVLSNKSWRRAIAHRLYYEKKPAVPNLVGEAVPGGQNDLDGDLWLFDLYGLLGPGTVSRALKSADPNVRIAGLRYAERFVAKNQE